MKLNKAKCKVVQWVWAIPILELIFSNFNWFYIRH